jgi:hypothetical protein
MPLPPRLKPGDEIAAEWLNAVRDAAVAELSVDPASGLEVYRNGPVTTLRRSKRLGLKRARVGPSGIDAAADATHPAYAEDCTIYDFDGDQYRAGATDRVYSSATDAAIGAMAWVFVEPVDGYWHVVYVECAP